MLDFVDEKTLSFNIRKPTASELYILDMHWLCLNCKDPFQEHRRTPRNHQALANYIKTSTPWEDRLSYPPTMVATKTIQNTTQLCSSAIDMEN